MSSAEGALKRLRKGGKAAIADALTRLEAKPDAPDSIEILNVAYAAPLAHVVGLTGPPGVGKSTLIKALLEHWRASGRTVGVIAVDPSSRRSGGALLGDRTRFAADPMDKGIFIRSMAARDRLGGIAALTIDAMVIMRAVFDIVLIETVGVGQSETDVSTVADTVVFCVQPGSGDTLQYIKAGIMEIPDIIVVTKGDMAEEARRTRSDVESAMALEGTIRKGWDLPVLVLSALREQGTGELIDAVDRHWKHLNHGHTLGQQRQDQAEAWLKDRIQTEYGASGIRRLSGNLLLAVDESPFQKETELTADLKGHGR